MYFNVSILLFLFGSALCQNPYTNKYLRTVPNVNNSYIVSDNRNLFGKKLRRIVKTGVTIAIIAKTGGTAALKKAAVAKLKSIAIKKGVQCLKNGLSNFCRGSKKRKVKPILTKKIKTKPLIKKNIKTKPKIGTLTKVNKVSNKVKKRIPIIKKKNAIITGCRRNYFDNLAKKVNNITKNVIVKPVNKGRDILKRVFGGNADCTKINNKKPTLITKKRSPNNQNRTITTKPSKKITKKLRKTGSPNSGNVTFTSKPRRHIKKFVRRTGSPTGSPNSGIVTFTSKPTRRVKKFVRRTGSPTGSPNSGIVTFTSKPTRRVKKFLRRTGSPTGSPNSGL